MDDDNPGLAKTFYRLPITKPTPEPNPQPQTTEPMSTPRHLSPLTLWTALLLVLTSAGCGLFRPGSASFASVKITGHSQDEIARVTTEVFVADGYRGGAVGPEQLLFEREGSRMSNIAYEGIANTHEGAQTVVRVKAEIVYLGADTHRLQCQAYMVRGAGQGVFEEEQRLANIRSGPYQSLLDKVAERLK